jgi:hypothetical protein
MKQNESAFLKLISQKRLIVTRNGNAINPETGNALGSVMNNGYVKVSYWIDGKVEYILMHRLVYIVHVGPIADGMTINHIDGDKFNNRPENLEAVTFLENMRHAYSNGLIDIDYRAERMRQSVRKAAVLRSGD